VEYGIFYLPTFYPELGTESAPLYASLRDQARRAEALGFRSFWLAEHHFHGFGGMLPSPQVVIPALAADAPRLRFGTAVALLPFHHPLLLAEDYATVDVLTGGRLDFGVGMGFQKLEAENLHAPLEVARERYHEHLEIIVRAWTQERLTFEGRFYRFENLTVMPRPVQRPHPPIWVGATATPDSFRWAGEHGYGIMTIGHLLDPAEIAERLALYREAYRAAGHPPGGERILGTYHAFVSPDRAEWEEVGRRGMTYYSRSSILAQELAVTKERGAAYAAHEPVLARMRALSFEDLVARRRVLIGEPAACRDTLAGLCEELGYTHVIFLFALGGLPYDAVLRAMDRFADEVLGLLPVA
jgi:natural product biosynthesis luciferase-like monooxygenase protein